MQSIFKISSIQVSHIVHSTPNPTDPIIQLKISPDQSLNPNLLSELFKPLSIISFLSLLIHQQWISFDSQQKKNQSFHPLASDSIKTLQKLENYEIL